MANEQSHIRDFGRVALRHVCPACLTGPLFRRGYELHERCPSCGQDLIGSDGAQYGGPMVLGYTVAGGAGIITALALILLVGPSPAAVYVALGVTVIAVFLTWKHCRASWTWLLYRTGQLAPRPDDGRR